MKLWKVEIKALPNIYMSQKKYYAFTGTATTAEIAVRQTMRVAKKDDLSQITIEKVECLGEKEFGK